MLTKPIYRLSILCILLIFSSLSTSAATLTVSNANDSGAGSLRQAVIDATSGDVIEFSITGTITLTSGQILIDKDLTIIGPGATSLAIDGNNNSRMFEITAGRTVNVFGMTFQNGNSATSGGAIENRGIMTIYNSTFSGNSATDNGGAIHSLSNSTMTIVNSTFTGNSATADGGAILNYSSTMTINNSTFSGNSAYLAGVIENFINSTMTINNSTFSGNSADEAGAILNYAFSTMTINNSTFSGNSAVYNAGAIFNSIQIPADTLTINNSTVSGNSAGRNGGAIYNSGNSPLTINNSTVSGNSANGDGGALFNFTDMEVIVNNSIFAGNTAGGTGDECAFWQGTVDGTNNIIGTNGSAGGCPISASDSVPAGAIGTVISGLANNGGHTQTHALVAGSPALDAAISGAISSDQRGVPAQSARDIGAFEDGASPTYPTVQFSSAGATYNETDGTVNIGLTISGASNFSGIAEVYVVDVLTGSATSGDDYTAFPFTSLSIDCTSGTCPTSATINLTLLTDSLFENDEITNLALVGTNGFATIGTTSTFAATIQDSATVTISANDATAIENSVDNGQFTVDLGAVNETGSTITVNYSISGTATNGVDYTSLAGSVDIPDGQQTATIDIVPLDDTEREGDETVELTLISTNNGSVSVDSTPATVTIVDDERRSEDVADSITDLPKDPDISVFDPAISKIGVLLPGQVGLVGEKLEWIITVTNRGNATGNNIVLVDNIIPALQIDGVSDNVSSLTDINGQMVTVTLPTLDPGQSVTYSIFTTVLESSITVNNTVCLSSDSSDDLCTTAQAESPFAGITQLPSTGQTPIWRTPALMMLVLGGLTILCGARVVLVRKR